MDIVDIMRSTVPLSTIAIVVRTVSAACMDESTIERLKSAPLAPTLARFGLFTASMT
jgi:hypothetical protein